MQINKIQNSAIIKLEEQGGWVVMKSLIEDQIKNKQRRLENCKVEDVVRLQSEIKSLRYVIGIVTDAKQNGNTINTEE